MKKPSRTEQQLIDTIRQLDKPGQQFVELMMEVMVDLQTNPRESALFSRWLATNKAHKGKVQRPLSELLVALRTGAWRDEVRRTQRHRVLKMAGGAR